MVKSMINYLDLLLCGKTNLVIDVYRNRQFGNPHSINTNWECIKSYQHIKQLEKTYLIFDIDKIDTDKVNLLFNNDFLTPNFYIYEYSPRKCCYTLQAFVLLDKSFNPDTIKQKYRNLCKLFGADIQYQIKTGIHKNPMFNQSLVIDEFNIKIPNCNHTGYLHSRRHNFNVVYENFKHFGYLTEIEEMQIYDVDNNELLTALFEIGDKIKVDLSSYYSSSKPKNKKPGKVGTRNITLFEETRLIAYSMADQSLDTILHIANRINNKFSNPLKAAEVKKTAVSIHKFIIEKFAKTKGDPFSDHQRIVSAQTRGAAARQKIIDGMIQLLDQNKKITISAINKITQSDKRTIAKYFTECEKIAQLHTRKTKKVAQKNNNHDYKMLLPKIPPELMPNFNTECDFIFNSKINTS